MRAEVSNKLLVPFNNFISRKSLYINIGVCKITRLVALSCKKKVMAYFGSNKTGDAVREDQQIGHKSSGLYVLNSCQCSTKYVELADTDPSKPQHSMSLLGLNQRGTRQE